MDKTVVIINPISGTGHADPAVRGEHRAAVARRVLAALGVPSRVEVTQGPGHGAALARAAVSDGAALVCAWGGDGTMNEIASALAFTPVPLGVIPGGSGNGLARELGISLKPERAIRQALGGIDRVLDAGEVDGRLFFNVAGFGFDAHIARCFNERGKRRGFVAYVTTSLVELFRYRPHAYAIAIEGQTLEHDALMVVVANGAQYGNGARVAPQARPDDGRLELVVVAGRGPLGDIWRARRMFDGTLPQDPSVMTRTIESLHISNGQSRNGHGAPAAANGHAPLWFHVDGEPVRGAGTLSVRVRPHALRVRVPAPAPSSS